MLIDAIKEQILQRSNEHNLNISSLEKKAGLPRNSLRNLMDGGSTNPGIKSLVAIAKVLECGIDELLDKQLSSKKETNSKTSKHSKLLIGLLNETVASLETSIKRYNIQISFEEFIEFLFKAYIYALNKNSQKVSTAFIEGLIEDKVN